MMKAYEVPDVTSPNIALVYLLSEDDQALPHPGAEYAARIGLQPVMIPGPHSALLTHPDDVAAAIAGTIAWEISGV
jgi:hypothetical protein